MPKTNWKSAQCVRCSSVKIWIAAGANGLPIWIPKPSSVDVRSALGSVPAGSVALPSTTDVHALAAAAIPTTATMLANRMYGTYSPTK